MNRERLNRMPALGNTEGYTLMETVTAIFVLSIIMFSVTLGASRVLRQTENHWHNFRMIHTRYNLHRSLLQSCSRIDIPYWETQEVRLSPSGTRAEIPFLDGLRNSMLIIDLQEGRLVISTETGTGETRLFHIQGISKGVIRPITNSATGIIDGISLEITLFSNDRRTTEETAVVHGYFSSRIARTGGADS